MKLIKCENGKVIKRVSRWITVQSLEVTKKHSLAYYADFSEGENGKGYVDAFKYNGKWYAVNQFHYLGFGGGADHSYTFREKDGVHMVMCFDVEGCLYRPLLMESSDYCEKVRLYI